MEKCTRVDPFKKFLQSYGHPLYPKKLYVSHHVYSHAETVSDILINLNPTYINYMDHCLLCEIVKRFGNDECRCHYQKYEDTFQMTVKRVRNHPDPVTDNDIEQGFRKVLKVYLDGDVNRTTPHDVQAARKALAQAIGSGLLGLIFSNQDGSTSVIFNFLMPDTFVQLWQDLCDDDLTVLANVGIRKIQVEEIVLTVTTKHAPTPKRLTGPSHVTTQATREQAKPTSLEYYLKERSDIPSQEFQNVITMMKETSDDQMNQICSESLLLKFSSCIQDWKILAPFLGMPEIYYDEFTTKYPGVADQNYQLLLFWKRKEGNNATYQHLLETVLLHGKVEEMKALIQIPLAG